MSFCITLLDGSKKEFSSPISLLEIAENISIAFSKKCVLALVNKRTVDLSYILDQDAEVCFVTTNDKQNKDILLDTLRHSCAHLLAQALKEIYKNEIQITIGPVIENGFYYDIDCIKTISIDDFFQIESKMKEIANRKLKVERKLYSRENAIEYFDSIGEVYKVEIIKKIPNNEELSVYHQGDFADLCRGPHVPNTSFLEHFKLTKISGAYWEGNSKNKMLQRIYGTCFDSKNALQEYLVAVEEAEKRDHRVLGQKLDLFHQQDESPGDVFWHEKGTILYNIITDYMRKKLLKHNYIEVKTPQVVSRILWEKSGHWEKYRPNMMTLKVEEEEMDFALKPMNCPCHVQIFNQGLVSYKQLPIRMAEFGKCHRYEPSGALHGLTRVRSFIQDDAHIFCTEEQVIDEAISFYNFVIEVYNDFDFKDVEVVLSTRPSVRAGSDEIWDKAENGLKDAFQKMGIYPKINEGEGAFYGPKIEFQLKDAIGRKWQCGTLQLDFVLPERLDAKYIASDGLKKSPVMLHRAILGSFERFIAILIENYAGNFPLWLAPVQAVIIGVNNSFDNKILDIAQKMKDRGIRIVADISSETVQYKVRKHSEMKIPYIVTIGQKEMDNSTLSIRKFGENQSQNLNFDEFVSKFVV